MSQDTTTETAAKPDRKDVTEKIYGILKETTKDDPSEELIAMGEIIQRIGIAIKGLPRNQAVAVMEAAAILHGIRL